MPSYSFSSNFNYKLNVDQLSRIISSNSLFTAKLSQIVIVEDYVHILFNQELSEDEQTYLNNIVANYVYMARDTSVIVSQEEASPNNPDIKAKYKLYCVKFDALPNTVTTHTKTFINNVGILSSQMSVRENMLGDELKACVSPNTTVGVLTQPVSVGDTVFNVSSSVVKNLIIGLNIILTDGINTFDCGEIVTINTGNNTIKVETPSQYNYNVGAFVQFSFSFLNMEIGTTGYMAIGTTKVGSTVVSKGSPLVFYYTNKTSEVKRVVIYIEVLY